MNTGTYDIDDRGNVVDCYRQHADGTWEIVARLDREAGPPPCDQLAWDNETGDAGIEDWLRANGYADELNEAMRNQRGAAGENTQGGRR